MKIFTSNEKNSTLGLDISDLSIKVVQLKKNSGKNKIQAVGRYNLKTGIVENGEIIKKDELVKAIKDLIQKPIFGSVSSKNVVASLPENKIFIKLFEVEKTSNQLEDMILPIMESNIPFSIDEIYYDWQIAGQNNEGYQVLCSAAPQKLVDAYIDTLTQAGLKVVGLETESMAICRCTLKEELQTAKNKKKTNDNSYALIDIGARRTTITIYTKNTIMLSMGIDVSGESTTQTIAETLQIKDSQAEKAKIICGLDKDKAEGIISDILSSMIKKMTERIEQILNFYEDNYPDANPVNKIFISGGGSNIKHFDKIIKESLKIETESAQIFTNIDEDKEKFNSKFSRTHNITIDLLHNKKNKKSKSKKTTMSTKHDSSLDFATAFGLALRNNL